VGNAEINKPLLLERVTLDRLISQLNGGLCNASAKTRHTQERNAIAGLQCFISETTQGISIKFDIAVLY
jgi:hypothetical protein